MRRHELLAAGVGVAGVGWPVAALAEQRVIGFVGGGSADGNVHFLAGFREGLAETGYTEGRNLRIEYRFAEGHYERDAELAADLVRHRVELIVTVGGSELALAAKTATSTIPIIFFIGGDPLWTGLVASFARPGGNATGVAALMTELVPKRLELLQEIAPNAAVAALMNPTLVNIEREVQLTRDAARAKAIALHILPASSEDDFETAFARLAELHVRALLVSADPFFASRRDRLVALAARYATPVM